MKSHFIPVSFGAKTTRRHYICGAAIACATGVTTLMPNIGAAQVAYDSAANSLYNSGWAAGQNGGYGFGAWSFDGTDGGSGQEMSSAGAIGTAWTLFNASSTTGISDVGRSILEPGGLQVGQTFETLIQNPTAFAYYRGLDILLGNSTTNLPPGDNTAALRTLVFNYFDTDWSIVDNSGYTNSPLTAAATGASGVRIDLTLTSPTTYLLSMTPSGDPSNVYQQTGTLAANLPITYIGYRLWDVGSSGPSDVADNFGISYMEIEPAPEPSTLPLAGLFAGALWLWRRKI